MYQSITQSDFTAAFHRAGRGNQFSHKALCALYDYLVDLEKSTGEEIDKSDVNFDNIIDNVTLLKTLDIERRAQWHKEKFDLYGEVANEFCSDDIPF